jgi:nicotinate-nucleotide adenylyltransferase
VLQANLIIVAAAARKGQTHRVTGSSGDGSAIADLPMLASGDSSGDNPPRMNIGLFGGTFDPVHKGHLTLARAAAERFHLGKIYFIPASMPPHRQDECITAFHDRYAMLALATVSEKRFLPSMAEAPAEQDHLSFTIDTVRRFKQAVDRRDHLFFIIGIDAFLQVASWHRSEDLLREVDFIVVSRPGFSMADVADALPRSLRPPAAVVKAFRKSPAKGTLALGNTMIHILDEVKSRVSATETRRAAAGGKSLVRFVEPLVAEYIKKMGLYKAGGRKQDVGSRTKT